MTTEKPKIDWTKPLQTTDGVKAELDSHLKRGDYYLNRVMTLIGDEKMFYWMKLESESILEGIQLINTPETKLVVFSINTYQDSLGICHDSPSEAERCKMPSRINRIDFSMQLEPGKNYEVTGVKEVA